MKKMRMQRAWNLGARLASCFWIHTKAVEIGSWEKVKRQTALMESVNRLCLRVVEIHVWVTEFVVVLDETKVCRSWVMILRFLEYGSGVYCGSWRPLRRMMFI